MKHYIAIGAFIMTVLFFLYDFFTRKLSNGDNLKSKLFRLMIYLSAIIAFLNLIFLEIKKILK
jgi:hypothetical protein